MAKVEHVLYGDRKVFTVSAFNRGIALHLAKLPALWVEGEVTELRRNEAWASVFLTLKDPETGATLAVTIARARLRPSRSSSSTEGETVHVAGRAEIYEQKGELGLRATTIERIGVGDHLLALEQLKRKLAAEGLFAPERKRAFPRVPRAIGILTGADAAARGDLVATIGARFPATKVVVCETRVQGKGAAAGIVAGLAALAAHPEVDVLVLARGGGSFEDLLPFSDEAVVRAVAADAVPVVSAVGHEQDTPLCDLAADVRAATPTAAGALVVPDSRSSSAALDATQPAARPRCPLQVERDRGTARAPGRAAARRAALAPRATPRRARPRRCAAPGALAARDPRPRLRDRALGRVRRSATPPCVERGDALDIQLATGSLGRARRGGAAVSERVVRGPPARARRDRHAARARRRGRRRGDRALPPRRGALQGVRRATPGGRASRSRSSLRAIPARDSGHAVRV